MSFHSATDNARAWKPSASMDTLRRRAAFVQSIRCFFEQRHVLEVETPLLSHSTATEPYLDSFEVRSGAQKPSQYLLTSPEFAMKRLLAAGSGPIFQISKAFRQGETGSRHNPEFTILEWYRPEFSLEKMKAEMTELLIYLGFQQTPLTRSYREAFLQFAGLDPFLVSTTDLQAFAGQLDGVEIHGLNRDSLLDIVLTHQVEPLLAELGAVYIEEFPASQASLARVCKDLQGEQVAKRFELYINGIEIANAYHELICGSELKTRIDRDNVLRINLGKPVIAADDRLLAAMPNLPDCAGIAVGMDRLFMVLEGFANLREVLAFPDGSI